jgi:hypothetical protein
MDPEVNQAIVMKSTQLKMNMKNVTTLSSQASNLLIIPPPIFILHIYLLSKETA